MGSDPLHSSSLELILNLERAGFRPRGCSQWAGLTVAAGLDTGTRCSGTGIYLQALRTWMVDSVCSTGRCVIHGADHSLIPGDSAHTPILKAAWGFRPADLRHGRGSAAAPRYRGHFLGGQCSPRIDVVRHFPTTSGRVCAWPARPASTLNYVSKRRISRRLVYQAPSRNYLFHTFYYNLSDTVLVSTVTGYAPISPRLTGGDSHKRFKGIIHIS